MRAFAIVLGLFACLVGGCGGSSGSGDKAQPIVVNPLATTVPLPVGPPVALTGGVPLTAPVYLALPAGFDWGKLVEASIDTTTTLANLSIVRTDGGVTPSPTVELSLMVAAGDNAATCSTGTQALRAEITGNTDFSTKSLTVNETVMPQSAIDIITTGNFTMCRKAAASVDVNLSLTDIGISFGFNDDCTSPQNIAGVWEGNYTCNDNCQGTPSIDAGTVTITVAQSGGSALYQDDSGATYVGSVCGTDFRHLGMGSGYFEYGTLTRTSPTTATKSSTWISTTIPQCGGSCSDTLTFTPN